GMGRMGGGMMGGRGGMMGGMGGMSRTMPPMMGMMMLAGQIVRLTGDFDSWDYQSQMLSFRAGFMGGMMGGGMMGGMGGMGGGMMGGMGGMGMGGMMGGGFRSIPVAGLPQATLGPERTVQLPTNLVSLRGPEADGRVAFPRKNEKLRIYDISQITGDTWAQSALRELAAQEAPQTVSQLVMWHVGVGFEWDTIARLSRNWANPCELELARAFVNNLKVQPSKTGKTDVATSQLCFDLTSRRSPSDSMEQGLHDLLTSWSVLGLKAVEGIPASPTKPSIAVRVRLDEKTALVQLAVSNDSCSEWKTVGKFHVDLVTDDGRHIKPLEVTDNLSEQILGHLIDSQIVRRRTSHGSSPYLIQVRNSSPLVLNALALDGMSSDPLSRPALMIGLSVPPHKCVTVPADEDTVLRLHLNKGMKPVAANLSGL
ncbi:MAG TPA: hypothetical protein VFT74_19950, partial [Isosphaeraceae bacterium]|nr:hypothetical protein [Isosphaeraceae bacterium]